ncbi:MAG: flagellar assembly protein FliX [Kiloniellales bacterium]
MKIDPLTGVRSSSPRRGQSSRSVGGSRFADELAQEPAAASSVSAQAPLGAIDSLLALQEVPDAIAQRRGARLRGESLLDQLDELRLGLLTGRLPRATVERLAALVARQRSGVDDPRLAEILAEIELRAAVELAKYEVRGRAASR